MLPWALPSFKHDTKIIQDLPSFTEYYRALSSLPSFYFYHLFKKKFQNLYRVLSMFTKLKKV